jgi:hypothetical protein
MNLGNRLAVAFQLVGTRAPAVARQTGVPVTSINALLRRGSKRSEFTERILAVIPPEKVSHEWVRTGQGTPEPTTHTGPTTKAKEVTGGTPAHIARSVQAAASEEKLAAAPIRSWDYQESLPPDGGWVFVPKLGIVHSSTGAGIEDLKIVLLIEDVQAFRAHWIRDDQLKPAALAWSQATDDSMDDVIYKGDSYVIDTSDTQVVDGKTYAIWYSGAERARKLFLLPGGGLRIAPNSPAFATVDLTSDQAKGVKIIGRVVHRSGKGGL